MSEIPGPPEPHNTAEDEFFSEANRQLIEATDEICQMRDKFIEQALAERGIDYQRALESVDLEQDDQSTPEAKAYLEVYSALMAQESTIAVHMTKVKPQDYEFAVYPDGLVQCEVYGRPDQTFTRVTEYRVMRHRIHKVELDIPGEQKDFEGEIPPEVVQALREEAALGLNGMPLNHDETVALVKMVKIIRRYVGQDLYGREPLPDDPA